MDSYVIDIYMYVYINGVTEFSSNACVKWNVRNESKTKQKRLISAENTSSYIRGD